MTKKKLTTTPRLPPSAKQQFIEAGLDDAPAVPALSASVDPKREERVVVYLTKDEIKRIKRYALEHEVKLTTLFRDAVMAVVDAE